MKKIKFKILHLLTISSILGQKIDRQVSQPFISGDDFRAYCKFVVDENHPILDSTQEKEERIPFFDPTEVKNGDTIFVNLAYLEKFFSKYHPKIQAKYVLITHNHDYSAPGKFKNFLNDPNLYAWFTQNCDITNHPKVTPIPIGLSNKHWKHSRNNALQIINKKKESVCIHKKKILLYVNIRTHTCPAIRKPILNSFSRKKFCKTTGTKSYDKYLDDLSHSKFVLSPHGNGLDCHRTWETLYMGSFPLVKTSTLDKLYKNLPVLIVKNWEEVTREFLETKYKEMCKKTYQLEKLYTNYWFNLIYSSQVSASILSRANKALSS